MYFVNGRSVNAYHMPTLVLLKTQNYLKMHRAFIIICLQRAATHPPWFSHILLCLALLPVIFGERSTRLVDTVSCGLLSWDLGTYEHSLKKHQCGWCAGHPVAGHQRQHSYKRQNVGFEIRGLGIEVYLFHYQLCNWASYLNSLHSFYHLIR